MSAKTSARQDHGFRVERHFANKLQKEGTSPPIYTCDKDIPAGKSRTGKSIGIKAKKTTSNTVRKFGSICLGSAKNFASSILKSRTGEKPTEIIALIRENANSNNADIIKVAQIDFNNPGAEEAVFGNLSTDDVNKYSDSLLKKLKDNYANSNDNSYKSESRRINAALINEHGVPKTGFRFAVKRGNKYKSRYPRVQAILTAESVPGIQITVPKDGSCEIGNLGFCVSEQIEMSGGSRGFNKTRKGSRKILQNKSKKYRTRRNN